MQEASTIGASSAPPSTLPITLQADRVRRRITASASVAARIAELAFGTAGRDDVMALHGLTSNRTTSRVEAVHG